MKALISIVFGAWMLALCSGLQAQTRVVTTSDPVFTRAELDQMLAPIALYPDTVLSHILIAATYPLEVVQAERWARANRHLEPEAAVNAAALEGWDPSVAALVPFPDLLARMSDDLDWTQNLGDAFLADEGRVMDAIQNLREKAYASGSLKKMKHVKVQREKQIIIIEPAVERVVYVPYYDTRVVYGSWWWDSYPPIYWHAPTSYVHVGGFYWGPRISLGSTFFFSSVHWPQRRVVVIDYHHHHHHPRFHSGRKIAHYHGARHWEHNPVHRRNIVYRSEPVRQRYANHDGGRRFSNEWRNEHRDADRRKIDQRGDDRRVGHRDERRHDAAPPRNEGTREFRKDGRELHNGNRERPAENKTVERRDQLQRPGPARDLNPGREQNPRRELSQEDRQRRAEQVRERLASNQDNRPSEARRAVDPQAQPHVGQIERRDQPRARDDNANREVRQPERPRHNAEAETRREQFTRSQPQQKERPAAVERREQNQPRQEANRDWQSRRAVEPARQERVQPPRNNHQEQRRFEQPNRGQRDHAPQGEQRRFER